MGQRLMMWCDMIGFPDEKEEAPKVVDVERISKGEEPRGG